MVENYRRDRDRLTLRSFEDMPSVNNLKKKMSNMAANEQTVIGNRCTHIPPPMRNNNNNNNMNHTKNRKDINNKEQRASRACKDI